MSILGFSMGFWISYYYGNKRVPQSVFQREFIILISAMLNGLIWGVVVGAIFVDRGMYESN